MKDIDRAVAELAHGVEVGRNNVSPLFPGRLFPIKLLL